MALQQCFRSITTQATLSLDYFIILVVALWQCSNTRKEEKEEKRKKRERRGGEGGDIWSGWLVARASSVQSMPSTAGRGLRLPL